VLAQSADFDVIVCDLTMPGMDGPDFYAALRERTPQLLPRVLFCSGGLINARLRQFAKTVPNQFLDKPVALEILCAAMDRIARDTPKA
jgi:CheY-like chemotaxis protein